MREITDTFLVAAHDYRDAFRSRRLLVWLVLYLCVAIGASLIFSQVLKKIEEGIAEVVAVDTTEKAGSVTTSIQNSEPFRKVVSELIEDDDLTEQLLTLPPLVLFYGWFSFTFMPLLVIILCSDTIARDVQTRYVRFNLFRTSRAAYAIGKTLSAASILLIALAISSVAVMIIGVFRVYQFKISVAAFPMMIFVVKCWIFSLSFLGVALLASQLRKSALRAQFLGIVLYFFLVIISPIAATKAGPGLARLWEIGKLISPSTYVLDLWKPNLAANIKATLYCLGLGAFYFGIGFSVFSRRDL